MRHMKGFVWIIAAMLVLSVSLEAAEQTGNTGSENKVAKFFRAFFHFPAKTADKAVGVATEAARKGTTVGTNVVTNTGKALTGSRQAAVDVVKGPIVDSAKVGYETTKGAVMAVPEAAQETAQEK